MPGCSGPSRLPAPRALQRTESAVRPRAPVGLNQGRCSACARSRTWLRVILGPGWGALSLWLGCVCLPASGETLSESSWALWKAGGVVPASLFTHELNEKATQLGKKSLGTCSRFCNVIPLATQGRRCGPWSRSAGATAAALAPFAPDARAPGATAGGQGSFCRRSWGPLVSPPTKGPAALQVRGLRGGDRTAALTFPGAAVRGSAPLRERARKVEPCLRGQGRAGHSILVQPKQAAASSTGRERLL